MRSNEEPVDLFRFVIRVLRSCSRKEVNATKTGKKVVSRYFLEGKFQESSTAPAIGERGRLRIFEIQTIVVRLSFSKSPSRSRLLSPLKKNQRKVIL